MRTAFLAAAVALACTLTACGTGDDAATSKGSGGDGFPMTIEDCGREVVLEKRPERVLTSGSTAATLMWAAGAAEFVTTRAAEGGAPLGPAEEAYEDVPQISPSDDLSREAIIGETPDLVINAGLNLTTPEDLEAVGIHSIVNAGFCDGTGSGENPDGDIDFDDVTDDIRLYGRIFGTEEHANAKAAELERRVEAVRERTRDLDVDTAAAVIVDGAKITAYGQLSMTHTQIEALGLKDVYGDLEARINEVSVESFIDRDPDVVIALYSGQGVASRSEAQVKRDLANLPGGENVSAIESGRVIALQAPYLLASPLSVDGLEHIADRLEPGS